MILTFYSYKGGVGRSMALANIGDALAREGLRVLMIDFDLEAPGLEQFFPVNYRKFRGHVGLLDLLLSYKQAMSQASSNPNEQAAFRHLRENFIVPVYDQLPSGGRLDLMPSGQRGDEDQLARYALNLRTFDWQDFYFNWAGELFFDWMRQTLNSLYDIVLVDSRTGVTELGGVCAYQLADTIAMFCASNYQNLQGTLNVIENFFSTRVRILRRNRPLQLLVIPSRVEQRDDPLLKEFHAQFEDSFDAFTPPALKESGRSFWDLMIPYEPHYAFREQVVARRSTENGGRQVSTAYQRLVEAVITVAEPDTPLGKLRSHKKIQFKVPVQYDITRTRAGYDLFLFYHPRDEKEVASFIAELNQAKQGTLSLFDPGPLLSGKSWQAAVESALEESRTCAVLLGPSGTVPWENEELRKMVESRLGGTRPLRLLPVLLPGSMVLDPTRLPGFLADQTWWDVRSGADPENLKRFVEVLRGESEDTGTPKASEQEQISPYVGLRPFQEHEAGLFFGREKLVQQAVNHLQGMTSLFLIGPSGSGKTSFVNAGLIPALRRDALPGSKDWVIVPVRAGTDPLESLAQSIARVRGTGFDDPSAVASLVKEFRENTQELLFIADSLDLGEPKKRWVLVVDQLEDLWTLSDSGGERELFLEHLVNASHAPEGPYIIIFVLRADYYARIVEEPHIGALAASNQLLVDPMTREELREAIVKPAQMAGLAFESGLVESILNDLGDESGALPLLQNVLYLLSQRSSQGFLTHAAYQSLGTLQGALHGFAEQIYSSLSPSQQAIARNLLPRLVSVSENGSFTRRRVSLEELIPAGGSVGEVEKVIYHFVDAHLLVTFLEGDQANYEIAHEAVIRDWPRFRKWLDEDRDALISQRRLDEAANAWDRSAREPSFLLRGARLAEAEEWAQSHADRLTAFEREFLQAGQAERQALKMREQRQARRLTLALVGGLILTSIASIVAIYFMIQSNQDKELNFQRAVTAEAEKWDLRTQVVQSFSTAEAFSVQSAENQATARAAQALFQQQSEALLSALNSSATTRSPDGTLLVTINPDGSLTIWDASSGRQFAQFSSPDKITAVSFSSDGGLLVTGDQSGNLMIWNVAAKQAVGGPLKEHFSSVTSLAFSPDGSYLASSDSSGMALIWEWQSARAISKFSVYPPVNGMVFNADGRTIEITDQSGPRMYDIFTGGRIATPTNFPSTAFPK